MKAAYNTSISLPNWDMPLCPTKHVTCIFASYSVRPTHSWPQVTATLRLILLWHFSGQLYKFWQTDITDTQTNKHRYIQTHRHTHKQIYIWVGFPRTGILPVLCHLESKLCRTAVANPNLLHHFFQFFRGEYDSLSTLPKPQSPINSLQCTAMHSTCTKNAPFMSLLTWTYMNYCLFY